MKKQTLYRLQVKEKGKKRFLNVTKENMWTKKQGLDYVKKYKKTRPNLVYKIKK